MSQFTPTDFVNFISSFTSLHNIELKEMCPHATTYRKTDEYFIADDSAIHFHSSDLSDWVFDLRKLLLDREDCDGFFCWILLEDDDTPKESFKLLVFNYDKLENKVTAFLSEKELDAFKTIDLDSEFPELNIDYSEPLVIH